VPKPTSVFACSACGAQTPKWHGQCPSCGEWNTLVEERAPSGGARATRAAARVGGNVTQPVPLREVSAERAPRLRTAIGELDMVLGGGLVPGSLVLLGGSPGIGKSTLTNMALGHLAAAGRATLYVSGEESAAQIRLRAERLGPDALEVPVLAETDLDAVLAVLEAQRPDACVIDSVQTLHSGALESAPGTVGQVREVATRISAVAKRQGTAVLLVGHVTKEGALAGPRVLEHLVDCVLQFEGERERTYRTLRALKNRFGSTNEVGVFEMREGGLVEVLDASARFVGEATKAPGSVVLAAMEGSRPLLVEVQALVSQSELVPPRRVCNGIDRNRLALVLAVLGRHAGIGLGTSDVFVNVVGGVRVDEPGADLAVGVGLWRWVSPSPRAGPPRAPRRSRASARWGSPASCARSPTPTGERRRRRSSDCERSSRRPMRRRCATPSDVPCQVTSARRAPLDTALTSLRSI
jgi:DNA repair protein RadA/Sms